MIFGLEASLGGFKIIANPFLSDNVWTQMRFPRSKKKRIRRKWAKQAKNFIVVVTPRPPIQIDDTLYMHPSDLERIRIHTDKPRFTGAFRIVE